MTRLERMVSILLKNLSKKTRSVYADTFSDHLAKTPFFSKMTNQRRVWIYHDKKWRKGSANNSKHKSRVRVHIDGITKEVVVPKKFVSPIKYNGRRVKHTRAEIIPKKTFGPRPERIRVLQVPSVVATVFVERDQDGDFAFMIQQSQHANHLFLFNDNFHQYMDMNNHFAGGGNACIRPFRRSFHAWGIPTGASGCGWMTLDEPCYGKTVKHWIDVATEDIVNLCLKNKYSAIYYCKSAYDSQELIGMGIFYIGYEVRQYITMKIKSVPSEIVKRSPEFTPEYRLLIRTGNMRH
jgi:hypothetical protein